jgi:hypothetical protein
VTITATNDGGLINPAGVSFIVADMATTHQESPPLAGATFTVSLPPNTVLSGPMTVTPHSSQGGIFYPSTVTLSNTSRIGTFVFAPASSNVTTISYTNSGGLTPPTSFNYTPVAGSGIIAAIGSHSIPRGR